MKPGKHQFWISADGYDEYHQDLEVIAGETSAVKGDLKGAPVGKLNIVGLGIEDATIFVDGKVLCQRGPCLKSVKQGDHIVTVSRDGYKPYTRRVNIQAKTETQIKVGLAKKPGRSDAQSSRTSSRPEFGGGAAYYLGTQSNKIRDEMKSYFANGTPPPDTNDPRLTKGKIYAIAADATMAVAGITAITAIYYTFRDKGAASTGLIDVRALAFEPQIGTNYAGIGMEGHF